MAASESLRFDIIGNDRASDAFSRVGRSAEAMSGKMGTAAAKAAFLDDALKRQAETARRSTDATLALAAADKLLDEEQRRMAEGALAAEFALKKQGDGYTAVGDKAKRAFEKITLAADRMRAEFPELKVKIDTAEAKAKLKVFEADTKASMDRINRELSSAGDGRGIFSKIVGSLFGGLFGGGGGGGGVAGAGTGGAGKAASGAGGLTMSNPYVAGGLVAAAIAASPFLGQQLAGATVFGLGSGLAGLGIAGAFGLGASATPAQVAAAQNALRAAQLREVAAQQANARRSTPSSQAALLSAQGAVGTARANLTSLQNDELLPGQMAVRKAFQNLSNDAQGSLSQIGKSFVPVMQSIFSTADSVLMKLTPVFAGAVKIISGPFKVFGDTLVRSFDSPQVKTSIDAVATAFGKILAALAPGLPGDVNEIATGITKVANAVAANPQAFATFINDLFKIGQVALSIIADLTKAATYIEAHFRPALHDTAVIFDGVRHEVAHIADDMASALIRTYNALWNDLIGTQIRFGHNIETQWNSVTHEIAVIFDGMRGQLGRIYNNFWNDTIGATIRFGHNVETQFNSLRHSIANIFDGVRHDIAAAWDLIWNNTVGRARNGVNSVIVWIGGLPGRISAIFKGAGSWLYSFGKSILQGLINGFNSIWASVANFFISLPKKILGWLGIHSPPDWAIQAGKDIASGIGIGMGRAHDRVQTATQALAAIASKTVGGIAGVPAQGGPATAQQTAMKMAALIGWTGAEWTALNNVAMRESGWSMTARNPSSGAYGIAQFINGPLEYASYGGNANTLSGQLVGFFNYIKQRYVDPINAWQHEVNYGWYDRGGWLPPGLTLAYNGTGQPEPVGAAARGGNTYMITVNVPPTVNPADAGRQVANLLGAHIKRGGRLYPAGVTPR